MSLWFTLLSAASVIAYAMVGGVLLVFSDFVMRSLDLTKAKGGIDAMQVINVEIMRSVFMPFFLGLAPVSLVIAVYAGITLEGTPARLLMAAGGLYLVGVFAVTVFGNVPLNNQLAVMDPAASQTLGFWKNIYMTKWVNLNSFRTVASLVSAGLTLTALVIR